MKNKKSEFAVSVVLPTYNERQNIKEMIKQLLFYLKNKAEIRSEEHTSELQSQR